MLNFTGLHVGADPGIGAEAAREPLDRETPGDGNNGCLYPALREHFEGLRGARRNGNVGELSAKRGERLAIPSKHFLSCRAYLCGVAQLFDFAHARKFSERHGETFADCRAADERAVEIKRRQAHAPRRVSHP